MTFWKRIVRARGQAPRPQAKPSLSPSAYLWVCARVLFWSLLVLLLFVVPYSFWWVYSSGDVAVERVVDAQAETDAQDTRLILFGSGISQDFVDYKLQLYARKRPTVVALGSSRVMQFREHSFRKPFFNMGGVAGNLPVLRSTVDAMLAIHEPEAIVLGLDFWWFMPTWNLDPFADEPPTSGSYTYRIATLKKPWVWLLEGKIGVKELTAPLRGLVGTGFREDRFGIMAQETNDGFAADGSWYTTAETRGIKKPFDFQFRDTLRQIEVGIKAFYHVGAGVTAPAPAHVNAFAEIYCRLRSRGIRTYIFIPPLAERVYQALLDREADYPHVFGLADALRARGIPVLDCSNPRTLGSNDCEFLDGFHGGEIAYLRVLRSLTDQWSSLLAYVNLDAVQKRISAWKGHAYAYDARVTDLWEVDFNDFGCSKRKK